MAFSCTSTTSAPAVGSKRVEESTPTSADFTPYRKRLRSTQKPQMESVINELNEKSLANRNAITSIFTRLYMTNKEHCVFCNEDQKEIKKLIERRMTEGIKGFDSLKEKEELDVPSYLSDVEVARSCLDALEEERKVINLVLKEVDILLEAECSKCQHRSEINFYT